jgi:hypothetical protein
MYDGNDVYGNVMQTAVQQQRTGIRRQRRQRRLQKRQKIGHVRRKRDPQGLEKNPFPDRAIARRLAIVPKSSTFLIFFISLWFTF